MAFQDCQWHIAAPIPDFKSRLGSGNRPYRPLQGHSSGQLSSAACINCLVDIPAGSGPLTAGDTVTVHLL